MKLLMFFVTLMSLAGSVFADPPMTIYTNLKSAPAETYDELLLLIDRSMSGDYIPDPVVRAYLITRSHDGSVSRMVCFVTVKSRTLFLPRDHEAYRPNTVFTSIDAPGYPSLLVLPGTSGQLSSDSNCWTVWTERDPTVEMSGEILSYVEEIKRRQ
jgi:hypothetical protein